MDALCQRHALPYQADPAVYFGRIHRETGAVLLDSGRPVADRGRYDILSAWPLEIFSPAAEEDGAAFFERLRAGLRALGEARFPDGVELPFAGGLLGYLTYEFGQRLDAPADMRASGHQHGGEAAHGHGPRLRHESEPPRRLSTHVWVCTTGR